MRTLIENLINKKLSLMVEKRRSVRMSRRRKNRNVNRRTRGYNRAFGNGDIDEKAVDSFIKYMVVTREGCLKKPYLWSLTRTVWAAKRIYEFAKTFKYRSKNITQADTICCEYFDDYFLPLVFQLAKKNNKTVQTDIYKRLAYMLNLLSMAEKYGTKNGWSIVTSNILAVYDKMYQYWFGENAPK